MIDQSAGSYAFGDFEENQAELERLINQARIGWNMEREMLLQAGLKPGMNVLDLACGPGVVSCHMAREVAPGRVLGADLSPDLLAAAAEVKAREGQDNVSFSQADVYNLDLPPDEFDFVYARFLFQHLIEPVKALENIRRTTKPGGRVCISDVDDQWLMVWPDRPSFARFTARAAEGQAANGGDRLVGRKIGDYLHRAGFSDIRVLPWVATSFDLGLKTFLDITTKFKQEQIGPADKDWAEEQLKDIYSLLEEPFAWGAVAVFVVTGRA